MISIITSRILKQRSRLSLLFLAMMLLSHCGVTQKVSSQQSFVENDNVELELILGNEQFGLVNQPLAMPLLVRAIDNESLPDPNQRIEFTVVTGTAEVTPYSNTNAEGIAEASVIMGPNPEHVQIKAYWPVGQREVIFDLFGSLALLKVKQAPGVDNASDCAGENTLFSETVIIELVGENNAPVLNIDVLVTIVNGALDQFGLEESETYSTANNGKIAFDITSGVTPQDDYKGAVQISAVVPSMLNVPALTINLDVTKEKFLQVTSPEIQYYPFDSPGLFGDFNFEAIVLGKCDTKLQSEQVFVEHRWSLTPSNYCIYDSTAIHGQDWLVLGDTFSDINGKIDFATELRVKAQLSGAIFPVYSQVQLSLLNVNSDVIEAASSLCED